MKFFLFHLSGIIFLPNPVLLTTSLSLLSPPISPLFFIISDSGNPHFFGVVQQKKKRNKRKYNILIAKMSGKTPVKCFVTKVFSHLSQIISCSPIPFSTPASLLSLCKLSQHVLITLEFPGPRFSLISRISEI